MNNLIFKTKLELRKRAAPSAVAVVVGIHSIPALND
jgi:hypothetical protein